MLEHVRGVLAQADFSGVGVTVLDEALLKRFLPYQQHELDILETAALLMQRYLQDEERPASRVR